MARGLGDALLRACDEPKYKLRERRTPLCVNCSFTAYVGRGGAINFLRPRRLAFSHSHPPHIHPFVASRGGAYLGPRWMMAAPPFLYMCMCMCMLHRTCACRTCMYRLIV